jgi:hypothetical protein
MKRILILIIAGLFLMIGSCRREDDASEEDIRGDIITDLIRESILQEAGEVGDLKVEDAITEIIPEDEREVFLAKTEATNDVIKEEKEDLPVIEEIKPEPKIQDKPVEVTREPAPSRVSARADGISTKGVEGCYIKAGNDRSGQSISPRRYIKFTSVVFNEFQAGRRVEFQLYAVPAGQRRRLITYYLIGLSRNIDVINGQAQYTRFWNGKNINGQFLPKGKYNIYLLYKIKDANGKVLATSGRYWGNSRDFYIRLD